MTMWAGTLLLAVLAPSNGDGSRRSTMVARSSAWPARVLWWEGAAPRLPAMPSAPITPKDTPDLLDDLAASGQLVLDDGTRVWLLWQGRALFELRGPGSFRLDGDRPKRAGTSRRDQGGVRAVDLSLRGSGIGASWVPWHRVAAADLSPVEPPSLELIRPRETATRELRPTLRWLVSPRSQRVDWVLWRLEEDGNLTLVERWSGVRGRQQGLWRSLRAGTSYQWKLRRAGSVAGSEGEISAWFHVVDAARLQELEAFEASLPDQGDPTSGLGKAGEVLLALALEGHGLLEEALASWRALATKRPDSRALRLRIRALGQRELVIPKRRKGGGPADGGRAR